MWGRRRNVNNGAGQTASTSHDYIPTHGGPVTGNGRTSNPGRKPKGVVMRGKSGSVLEALPIKLRFPKAK